MLGFSHTQLSLPTFATCCDFGERHILSLNGLEIRQCTELRKSWSAPLGGIFASCAEVSEPIDFLLSIAWLYFLPPYFRQTRRQREHLFLRPANLPDFFIRFQQPLAFMPASQTFGLPPFHCLTACLLKSTVSQKFIPSFAKQWRIGNLLFPNFPSPHLPH